ncbi:MAG: YHS domain-containing protein [Ignavibacteriales bacterium]
MHRHTDPVCHMEVDPDKAAGEAEHQGKKYYFCSPRCRETFEREPAKYTGGDMSREGRGGRCGS